MLSPELNAYFDMLDETFGTPGWSLLTDEAKRHIYKLQADALEAKTWDEVLIMRGRALQLDDLVNMRDAAQIARKAAEADAEDAESEQKDATV